ATNGQVVKSIDSGASFTVPGASGLSKGNSLWASSDGLTYLAAGGGGDRMQRTIDGGANWTNVRAAPNSTNTGMFGPFFVPGAGFYAFGASVPVNSQDGVTWTDVVGSHISPAPVSIRSVFFNGYVSPAGMPFTLAASGALVFGPP